MTKNQMVMVAAILTTLADCGGTGREGPMYAALMAVTDLSGFQWTLGVLASSGLIVRGPSFAVTLTADGIAVAAKLSATLAPKS